MNFLTNLSIGASRTLRYSKFSARSFSSLLHPFDETTAVERVGQGSFSANITNLYSVGPAPNGGYLASIAVNAAKASFDVPVNEFDDCLSVSGHFHTMADHDNKEAEIETRIMSKSRSSASVQVNIVQQGITRCSWLVLLGNLSKMKGITAINSSPPVLPPREDCINASAEIQKAFNGAFKLADEIEFLVPKTDAFALTTLAGKSNIGAKARVSGWMRFAEDRVPNCEFFCDAITPPSLNLHMSNWVPSLEYSCHFFSNPMKDYKNESSNWVKFRFASDVVQNGLLDTDGEIWSAGEGEDGSESRILARSRQLARHLIPREK